ncbi:TIGR04076 family protein [Hutsoniella sourekii]
MEDLFTLYDLKVEVVATGRPFVCSHQEGDYFLVVGENLVFEETHSFSMYALSALLPLLPAKQRLLQANDWMLSDASLPVRTLIVARPSRLAGPKSVNSVTKKQPLNLFTKEEKNVRKN